MEIATNAPCCLALKINVLVSGQMPGSFKSKHRHFWCEMPVIFVKGAVSPGSRRTRQNMALVVVTQQLPCRGTSECDFHAQHADAIPHMRKAGGCAGRGNVNGGLELERSEG
jgi:hypothetical protein